MSYKGDTPPPNVSAQVRLCQRPPRVPGKAPPCEDDKLKTPGLSVPSPVTLPKLKFLEKVK